MLEESKYYSYVNRVLETICEYYNYKFMKLSDNLDNIKKNILDSNEPTLKVYYFNALQDELGLIAKGFKSNIIIVDIVSLCYRFLEEIGLNDICVKIKTNQKEILKYLAYLDVDYEVTNESTDDLIFEVFSNNTLICTGAYDKKENIVNASINTNSLVKEFRKVANFNEEKGVDVYVTGFNMEERLTATLLVQNLRWSEIITEMDYNNKTIDEQEDEANKMHARIIVKVNNEELSKGLLIVKDNITKEETKIDEAEILDYIISNL